MADWNAIRAEYIGGGISQRKLAAKYGIPVDTLLKRANKERWNEQRATAYNKGAIVAQQKTADAQSDFAAKAAKCRAMLIEQLAFEIQQVRQIQEGIGSETDDSVIINEYAKDKNGKIVGRVPQKTIEKRVTRKLKDLTAAYKDLTGGMNLTSDSEQVRVIIDV